VPFAAPPNYYKIFFSLSLSIKGRTMDNVQNCDSYIDKSIESIDLLGL
jgi:hypothetical protein